jgi:hypothetical protein
LLRKESDVMRLLKPAAVYFVVVFGAGFVLGTIRVLLVVPHVGARTAELLEVPLMLAVTFLAARWTGRRFATEPGSAARIGVGFLALGFLLAAELVVGAVLRGASAADALLNRDPVSGTAYYVSLLVFALMPWLLGRHGPKEDRADA